MPYKKRRYPKKRKYHRKKRYALTSMGSPSGLPIIRTAKLRYVDSYNLTSASGLLTSQVFRANSIYDPDVTGVGHQPLGHDQWEALYNHYVVKGSRIQVKLSPAANTTTVVGGVYLSDTGTPPYADWTTFIEARKGSSVVIPKLSTGNPKKCMSNFSAKGFFNITDIKDNQDKLGAVMSSNPTDVATFIVWVQSQDKVTTSQAINVEVIIDYIVEFSEPKDITQS